MHGALGGVEKIRNSGAKVKFLLLVVSRGHVESAAFDSNQRVNQIRGAREPSYAYMVQEIAARQSAALFLLQIAF